MKVAAANSDIPTKIDSPQPNIQGFYRQCGKSDETFSSLTLDNLKSFELGFYIYLKYMNMFEICALKSY